MGSLQGKRKCTSTSDEAAANAQPGSPHIARGGQMWNTKPEGTFCSLTSHRKSFYSKKHHLRQQLVHSSQHGALVLAMKMDGLWPPRASCRIRTRTENSVPELDVTRIPTLLKRSVYFWVPAKISLLFGNNSSWNPLFYPIFFYLFMWVSDEHSLYSLMVRKIQYM